MSRRKTLPPVGEPRQGELIVMAFRPEGASKVYIDLPAGFTLRDMFGAVLLSYSWQRIGGRRGDYLITLQTDDVREGDYVEIKDGDTKLIGQYHFEDAVHYSIQTIDEALTFQVDVRPILGRVVGIWREKANAYIHRDGIFRPLHETATIYQFKRRA
jgi:hypothetical protein